MMYDAQPATLTFILERNGAPYEATAGSYRVIGGVDEDVIVNWTAIDPAALVNSGMLELTVAGSANTLDPSERLSVRIVEVKLTSDDFSGEDILSQNYMVVSDTQLVVMENSFMTYGEALTIASQIPRLDAFNNASKSDRIAGLTDAYLGISRMKFNLSHDDKKYAGYGISGLSNPKLWEFTQAEFNELPADFKQALKYAQVAEASSKVGGDVVAMQREAGLLSSTVGEVSQMYRSGKPVSLSISSRAMEYLRLYLVNSVRIGRA